MAVLAAGAWLAGDLAGRLYRPRNLIDAAAFIVVASAAAGWATERLITRGVIKLNVRCPLCGDPVQLGQEPFHMMVSCGATAGADPAV